MLDGIRHHYLFENYYHEICCALGFDPILRIKAGDNNIINANEVSSLLTVFVSVIAYDHWRKRNGHPKAIAGYSVGQWTALYAAGVIPFKTLVRVVAKRAAFMNECFAEKNGAMIAVIGLDSFKLEMLCSKMRDQGLDIFITNYNCSGQHSIAGSFTAINLALKSISELKPIKMVQIPTSGAWHCPLVDNAAIKFRKWLEELTFLKPTVPIIDNASGTFLPDGGSTFLDCLARQINHPVLWDKGIKNLIGYGCEKFVEVGYGNILTKFGFFIDRNLVKHLSYYPNEKDI